MNINEIPKQYDPKDAQDRWYEFWVQKDISTPTRPVINRPIAS